MTKHKLLDPRIRKMQEAVTLFGLLHPRDRWLVASILVRHHTKDFDEALVMTPEVTLEKRNA